MSDFEEKGVVKKYSNGEITIVWKREACIHATHCFAELPEVFDPAERPWINASGASTDRIIKQVERCPTDALTYYYNNKKESEPIKPENMKEEVASSAEIEIIHNGPAILKSKKIIIERNGEKTEKEGMVAICRCGQSENKPYCDGTHYSAKFE